MRKKAKSDIENTSQPEVETNASGRLGILNWLCHHAGQIAKGSAALLGLAALGGIGFLARGAFSGTKKTDTVIPEVNANATDGRSIVARKSAGIAAKSEDLTGFSDAAKEVEEIVTPGVKRSLLQNDDASSQSSAGTTTVNNLVVNGAIPDQLIQIGYPWSGSINITELFGGQVNITGFSQVGNQPLPDWLQTTLEIISVSGLSANGVTVRGNLAYVAGVGLEIIDISNSVNPVLIGVSGFDAYGVTVKENLAYVVANNGNDLQIIDISNSTDPVLIGSILLGFNAYEVTVGGNLAYVAAGSGGLEIIDISNIAKPVLIGCLSGFYGYGVTVSYNLAYVAAYEGLKIIDISNSTNPALIGCISGFVAYEVVTVGSNFAYIAAYEGLKIIDISNKTNPFLMSGVSGFVANGVIVSGNLAYIATDEGLQIIDISDNAYPSLNFDASGFSGKGITVSGNLAYIAADEGLEIIDLSQWQLSGTPIQSKCFYPLAINVQNSHGSLMKIFNVRTDNFPCVVGSIPNQSLNPGSTFSFYIKMTSIFNDPDKTDTLSLAINPHSAWLTFGINPFFMAKKTNFYSSSIASDVTIKGNFAYVTYYNTNNGGLKIIDISNSTNPVSIGSISGFSANGVTVRGNFAYIATSDQGLQIIDISNSSNPVLIDSMPKFTAREVIVIGNFAYVADSFDQGLQIIDISNSTNPVLMGGVSGFSAYGAAISGNFAYISYISYNINRGGLKIIDINNSIKPVLIGEVSGFQAMGVTVVGNFAYIAAWDQGLKIIDISNSTDPVLIGSISGFGAERVIVNDNFAYIVVSQGLKIIDVSQPTKPIIVGEVSGIILKSVTLQENEIYAVGDCFSIFDVTNYQFSGTPANSDAGNYNIAVIVTDPDGAKAQTNFTIRVEGGPRLNSTIPPQIALIGQSANFFLDQGTFYDPNEDVITYSASLANGGKLPYFLSFNPSSATFSGIPTSWDKGNYMVTIFASDRIVYPATPANFVLTVQDPIADQTFIVGRNAFCVLAIPPDTTFNGRSLVYSVKPRNSAGMPQWMYFNAANRTLFAAPNAINVGITSMQVMLNDGYGEAFFLFSLNVKFDTPPILGSMISTQTAEADKFFQFALPGGTFTDADGDTLSYSVNLGGASWLKFDFSTQTFSGTPSGWSDAYPYVARKYTITVTAIDPSNKAATGAFELNLNGPSSWEILINASIAVLGVLVAVYGYAQKKYLLWDFFKKEKYMKPIELLTVGATEFSHRINFPADHIKSIIVTLSHDRSCTQNMSPCLRKTLGFFPGATKDTEERIFSCSGISAYLFPWLFYDSEENVLKVVKGGPTGEFVGKDIKIQVRGTDNRIMEEFHIKVRSQLSEAADEEVKAIPSSKAKHKKDTAGLGEPLISPIAANNL